MVLDPTGSVSYFAIVPAAGHSRRMGSSKLLLPFPVSSIDRGETKVIDAVLHAWTTSRVEQTVVVMRSDDDELRVACDAWPVQIVIPKVDPVDMKQSLQIGLRYIERHFSPTDDDCCFIAPADLPTLSDRVIGGLIAAAEQDAEGASVVVPRYGEAAKYSHPALIRWSLIDEIFQLADDEGVDQVVKRHPQWVVEFPEIDSVTDIDTPEEYQRALDRRR